VLSATKSSESPAAGAGYVAFQTRLLEGSGIRVAGFKFGVYLGDPTLVSSGIRDQGLGFRV